MKRYDPLPDYEGYTSAMDEVPDGEWVLFDDLPAWIPVGKLMPEEWQDVIVATIGKCTDMSLAWQEEGEWRTYDCGTVDVTHWMPLPEMPS